MCEPEPDVLSIALVKPFRSSDGRGDNLPEFEGRQMRNAETVTFGGGGLERAAHLRGDGAALAEMMKSPNARVLPIWRGKPLVQGERLNSLVLLPPEHPVAQLPSGGPEQEAQDMVFLGLLEDDAPIFASDISGWVPDELDEDALGQFLDRAEQQHPDLEPGQVFAELRRIMTRLSPLEAELAATAKAIRSWHDSHRFCARCGQGSEVMMAGWQRTCPSCGAHHFPRTDPVVIMLITRGNSVLLGRSHGWPEGMYSCLAGFVEPGETVEAAVRREVKEEAGIDVGAVRYVASQPWPFPAALMIGCHGEALGDEITIDPAELDDALWISREDVMDAFAGNRSDLLPARKGAIAHFLLRNWLADRLT
jgi:NAD+ diphosphatase